MEWKGRTQWTQVSHLQMIVNSCKDPLLVRERKVCSLHLHTTKRRERNLLRVRYRLDTFPQEQQSQVMASFSSMAKYRMLEHNSPQFLFGSECHHRYWHYIRICSLPYLQRETPMQIPEVFYQLILSPWHLHCNQLPQLCQLLKPAQNPQFTMGLCWSPC